MTNTTTTARARPRSASARRLGPLDTWLPFLYLVAALLLVVLVLPSVLRVPPQEQNASAEFSPDAPPDDDNEAIVSSVNAASTATAGTSSATGDTAAGETNTSGPSPVAGPPARACPRGFGTPPRQAESLYAAPCAPTFAGSNGGATAPHGVSATEVRVVMAFRGGDNGLTEGPVPPGRPDGSESAVDGTLRAYQAYFNEHYQLWGRTLRLFAQSVPAETAGQAAAALEASTRWDPFAAVLVQASAGEYLNQLTRREIVTFSAFPSHDSWYQERRPYAWGWNPAPGGPLRLSAEFLCANFAGKPAVFAGDPALQGNRRVFGLLYADLPDAGRDRMGADMERFLLEACGEKLAESVGYNVRSDQDRIATAMTNMRAAGVTTIILAGNAVAATIFAGQADQQGYFPEWFFTPVGGDEHIDANARTISPAQWRHAFGLSFAELPRLSQETDAWRAYKSIDPRRDPDANVANAFYPLLQVANGIQQAGPRLRPETFEQGLVTVGRRPPEPRWSVGGGFAPGDFTYADHASVLWWDPVATGAFDGQPGAYRYPDNGRRFTHGSVPRGDTNVFREGTTQPR